MKKRLIIVLLCFLFPLTANAGNVTVTDAENVEITQDKIVIIRKQNDSQADDVSQPEPDQGSASPATASAPQNQQSGGTTSQNAGPAEESGGEESSNPGPAVPTPQNEAQGQDASDRLKSICDSIEKSIGLSSINTTYKKIDDTCKIGPAESEDIQLNNLQTNIIEEAIAAFKENDVICDSVEYKQPKKWSTTCKDAFSSKNVKIIFDYGSITIKCENSHDYFAPSTGKCTKIEEDGDEAEPEDAASGVEEAPQEQLNQNDATITAPEAEEEIAEAGTLPKTEDDLIGQLRKDAEQIVNAYKETKTRIEAKLKTPDQ